MALANRVYVNTATTGTGTLTLGAAVDASYLTPDEAALTNGATVTYLLKQGLDVEVGRGVWTTASDQLTRDTVLFSKIGGTAGTSKINLAGTPQATVMITPAAEDLPIYTEASTAPVAPRPGDKWLDTSLGILFTRMLDSGGEAWWVETSAAGAGVPGQTYSNATTTIVGVVELATQAEAEAQSDTERAVTPNGLANYALNSEVANALRSDVADQTVAGGARVTVLNLGNSGTGTITPDPGDRPFQKYTNTGAHTLAPGSNYGMYMLDIINGSGAGAITTSSWTLVDGDPFTTTNGHKFRCHASISADASVLVVKALQ